MSGLAGLLTLLVKVAMQLTEMGFKLLMFLLQCFWNMLAGLSNAWMARGRKERVTIIRKPRRRHRASPWPRR